MSNNIFYKALAAVSTVGIVVIAGIQVTTVLKKGNNAEDQLAKTLVEIKNLRKEALAEVNLVKKDVLQELNSLSSDALEKVETVQKLSLSEVKTIRTNLLKEIDIVRSNSLNEIKADRANALGEVKTAKKEALQAIAQASGSNEGKVWLVLKYGGWKQGYISGFDPAIEKIPMRDMDQCQIMGAQWISSPRAFDGRYNYEKMAFICLEE